MKFKDKSVTEKLAGSFAIALPEYLVRYDDECDTVFEKIEAEMRPANYPLLDSAYDDNKTTFEKVAAKIRPMHLKMKRRKMITREQPITRYAPVIAKKNIIVDMQGKKLRVVATIRKGGDDNVLGNIPYLLAGKPVQVPTAAGVVTETWEDVYGNNVRVTEELKKLKIATEEALRKDEDEKYQKDRMKKINVMLNICNLDMANKQELKKNQQKFEIKSMNQKDLIKVLKANKEDDVVIQHTQCMSFIPVKLHHLLTQPTDSCKCSHFECSVIISPVKAHFYEIQPHPQEKVSAFFARDTLYL
ncbi:unnamed protein product [Thelazia callipaeda]|uniref:Reverse transcriptase domain-containing protein n=1 Tax=Thelazia callipaeda TaxID=103827 RepID=A0A0N5D622_THECL|nr:unnamed protein product [Thelazia callipaeda]